jgi:signal transduction histidine kinase
MRQYNAEPVQMPCAPVAQRLEQQTHNLLVRGSNPCGGTNQLDLPIAQFAIRKIAGCARQSQTSSTDQLMSQPLTFRERSDQRGKLRIGNDWNAITIIALSQSNPLKAIAELVENSIDARAAKITIVRGRSDGRHYLEVRDNGQGIPRDASG